MTVHLTPAQARKLGIDAPAKGRTRATAPGPYHTRCTTCHTEFTTRAAEDRHVLEGHCRYELVFP